VVSVAPVERGHDEFFCSTRRGKQFNSMIHADKDPLTGAHRDAVYIDAGDAATLGIADGDRIRLRGEAGAYEGSAKLVRLARHSVQVHWPEGNVLLGSNPSDREPASHIPDYNSVVRIERV
jgi:anaerobic selenocysteine-containing dehydrogenase